jgi:hypothetical protein
MDYNNHRGSSGISNAGEWGYILLYTTILFGGTFLYHELKTLSVILISIGSFLMYNHIKWTINSIRNSNIN